MLQRATFSEDYQPSNTVLCAMGIYSCPDAVDQSGLSVAYVAETLSNAVITLEPLIDHLDLKLRSLDGILEKIRQLLAAESLQAVEAQRKVLADPLYRIGLRQSQQLPAYEARLQAVANILGFHRAAANHVMDSRGRLGAVREELKVLKRIMEHLRSGGQGPRLWSFVEALRSNVLRLQSAQNALTGGYSVSSTAGSVTAGVGEGGTQLSGKPMLIGADSD